MAKYLVIVESPAKVKTIKKFLGSNYEVVASNGHVRDLPKSTMGIDMENDYEPKYITIRGKGEVLAALRKAVKKADKVYLATDPDREGEAISWHLYYALKLENKNYSRITFNEITKTAVKDSIKHARDIDMNLVDAQQARRVLDRIVGYQISPILWAKIKRGLSAGRVQSVALRLICDREEEINLFIPQEYWSLEALLDVKGSKKPLEAKLIGNKEQKIEIHSEEEMKEILSYLKGKEFTVEGVKVTERLKKSPLPFTTSTLQQDASSKLNFAPQKTMRIAQQLYEGVNIKGQGTVGLITYLRTDSTRISVEADAAAKEYIKEAYGAEFVGAGTVAKKDDKKVQDAHEAIRPTYMTNSPASIKDELSRDQFRLYQLIWNRFMASRMAPAKYENTSVKIAAGDYRFNASASKMSQGNIKAIQQQNNQHRVNAQCDGACNTGNPVNSDHENNNNRKTNCTGNQARTDRCRSELCAYYVGTQLLQLQLQTADTDGRSEVFRLFKGAHAIDDCLTVCDFCLYRRCADHLIVINDVNNIMVRICCLCRIRELFGSICSHSQRYNRLLIIHTIGLIGCLCICYIRTA